MDKGITKKWWEAEMDKKGGEPQYMRKEIYEQPKSIINAQNVDRKIIKKVAYLIMDSE